MLALLSVTVLTACTGGSKPKPGGISPLPGLARDRGIALGAEFVQSHFNSDSYRDQVIDNFTSITPNRSFKWGRMEPQHGVFDFEESDTIVNFAAANHLRVRGCCLAWSIGNPSWLTQGHWTKAQAKDLLREYITTVVGHFRGRVAQWDVVNEGLKGPDNGPFSVAGTTWGNLIGPEYIADAFRWAHEADPGAQLFYNDYGAEAPGAKFNAELQMVKLLQQQGVPITGVGLQTHRKVPPPSKPYYPTMNQVVDVLQAFERIGVHTELTELDQPLKLPPGLNDLQLQAELYREMVTACLMVATCTGVTVWGVNDNDRYQQLRDAGLGAATLFMSNGRAKPAFRQVMQAMRNADGPAAASRPAPGAPPPG